MTYTLVSADENLPAGDRRLRVFLGGNCRGRDWRLDFYRRFSSEEIIFFTPKRYIFADPDMDPVSHANQVGWERQAIDRADVSVFWLGEGLANQASRVEIGYALGKGCSTLMGAAEGFLGLEHLSAFSGMVLSTSVEGLMARLTSLVEEHKLKA